jgi:hypothetical protein
VLPVGRRHHPDELGAPANPEQRIQRGGVPGVREGAAQRLHVDDRRELGRLPRHAGNNPVRNSIAWNVSVFELVEAHTIGIPYFDGKLVPMPYVLLEHRETGRLAWFINIHNPASVRGPAQHWRDVATSKEIALMNDLQAPQSDGQAGVPTFLTGDFNEKSEAFCRVTAGANAQAANGGTASPCRLPAQTGIDWIFGSTPGVSFSGYVRMDGGLVARATDHPLVFSDVTLSGAVP